MNLLDKNPMNEYKKSLRNSIIQQGVVAGIEVHRPFGEKMECAIIHLNNGLKGLIHGHQFDKQKYRSLIGFIDHKIDYMVLDVKKQGLDPNLYQVFDEEKGIVLLSRVQALAELQEDFWETAEEEQVCTGTVSGFENERLYVLVQGVDCVLPIQDYEYDWTPSARNLLPLGSEITVKIKKINQEKKQVTLTRKELLEDPWNRIHDTYGVGNSYSGTITGVVDGVGIFIKLKPGVESLAWFPNKVPSHGELLGKRVTVMIKNINVEGRRIRSKILKFPHDVY